MNNAVERFVNIGSTLYINLGEDVALASGPWCATSIRMYIGDHELWTKDFTSIMSDTKTEIRRGAASVIDYDANS